jgi:type II restriction enzyme
MNTTVETAILDMYVRMDAAAQDQAARGGSDQGARAEVTSGKHMDEIAEIIVTDLIREGFDSKGFHFLGNEMYIPGWFRATKNWDILAFDEESLISAIELKSINSSFGNNLNNRAEEAVGSATDAAYAIDADLIGSHDAPPVLGYALVVRECASSKKKPRLTSPYYAPDEVFSDTSYLDRFEILCKRLQQKRLYQAVWLAYADTDNGTVREPDEAMTYEKFIASIAGGLSVHRA